MYEEIKSNSIYFSYVNLYFFLYIYVYELINKLISLMSVMINTLFYAHESTRAVSSID